ncbi:MULTISPECIES: ammonium transporter [Rhodococcus]|uniref:ammonium transporter n=1 Tax=Rhodococcus TaxID=1827 RepID=UPI00163959F5|nr:MULTISPECIES: ammonium transporter [Rhodococcus]MBC2589029.1 ammonium transporter [Rhodococcus aetherivorans]QRI77959.1 ammonium transporter [Rhodococcus aetherivorans]QSE61375.1 ammonium transporter [Rhodococcus sp. PSBB066]QSE67314.1 ammonium transporter [Rhodococcus sp. PSBB049]
MKFRKLAAVAAMTIAAVGVTAGTSYAAPAVTAPEKINYETKAEGDSVVTVIDAGSFAVSGDGKSVELQDSDGNAVVSLPLAIQLGDLQLPFEREISEDGKTLTLTPVVAEDKLTPVAPEDKVAPGLSPVSLKLSDVASPEENLKAQQNFASQLGIASAVGGLTGGIIGCLVAGIPVGLLTLAVGALPACAAGFGIGSVVGTIAAGGPTLVIAGIGLIQTLTAPPGTTQWAE